MTSFSTAGGGVKAATTLLTGRTGYHKDEGANLAPRTGSLRVTVAASTPTNVINVTGSGILMFSYLSAIATSTVNTVVITIDGTVVLNDTQNRNIGNNQEGMIQAGSFNIMPVSSGQSISYASIPFNTTLLVNVTSDAVAYYYYNYYLT